MEFFEDLTLSQAPTNCTPHMWKRYVHDTFCILKKGTVEKPLGHLNTFGQPSNSPWRSKEMDFSHFWTPYSRGRMAAWMLQGTGSQHTLTAIWPSSPTPLTTLREVWSDAYMIGPGTSPAHRKNLHRIEERQLASVLKQNGYPSAFIRFSAQPQPTQEPNDQETEQEGSGVHGQRPLLVMLPYVSGVSEDIRRVCKKFGLKVIFRSGRSLRFTLTKVKDALPDEKKSKVVYQIPCSCGKTYIGETTRRLEARMKEHQDVCCRGMVEKSAVTNHRP